jgi:hypothetical protein
MRRVLSAAAFVLFNVVNSAPATAQTATPATEASVLVPVVTFQPFNFDLARLDALGRVTGAFVPPPQTTLTEVGIGGRIAHRVSSRVWLETELDWMPKYQNTPKTDDQVYTGGSKLMLTAAPTVRFAAGPATIMGRLSGGLTRLQAEPEVYGSSHAAGVFPEIDVNDFLWIWTVAPGAAAQFGIGRVIAIRFDVDDVILRSKYRMPEENVPTTRNNFRETVALVFRFDRR